MTIKTWKNECTRQLTRMMDLMPSDFTAVHSTLAACAMIPNKHWKLHKARWAIQLLNHLVGLPNRASSRYFQSDQKHSDIYLEVLSLQNRKSFEYLFRFHRTLGISPKDLEGFKADIAFIYTTLACSLVISTNLNFDLTSFGLYFIRCAFWLVSRKDDCLESVLRKSFWIKKLINKILLHLSN